MSAEDCVFESNCLTHPALDIENNVEDFPMSLGQENSNTDLESSVDNDAYVEYEPLFLRRTCQRGEGHTLVMPSTLTSPPKENSNTDLVSSVDNDISVENEPPFPLVNRYEVSEKENDIPDFENIGKYRETPTKIPRSLITWDDSTKLQLIESCVRHYKNPMLVGIKLRNRKGEL